MLVQYFIKYPNKKAGRASFTIVRRINKNKNQVVENERTKAISKLYKEGVQDFETCKEQVIAIVSELRAKDKPDKANKYLDANLDILQKYWLKKYARRRIDESSKHSAHCSFKRALSAIGELNIASAPIDKLQAKVDKFPANKQRRLTKDINALLKFAGREELLEQSPEQSKPVQHLTHHDFEQIIRHIEDKNIKTILYVAFTTGMRLGEIFGATNYNETTQCVPVFTQIKFNGNRTATKTRTKRFAAVDPIGIPHIKKWLSVDTATKNDLRKLKFSEITRQACKKAFPHDSEKWCRFHDLRHSYAIHLLSKGIPMDLVALSLGNSITVCQKYYVGFSLTNYQTEIMKNLLNAKELKAA